MFKEIIDELSSILVSTVQSDILYRNSPKPLCAILNMRYNIDPDEIKKIYITSTDRIYAIISSNKGDDQLIYDDIIYDGKVYNYYSFPEILFNIDENKESYMLFESCLFVILSHIQNKLLSKLNIGLNSTAHELSIYFVVAAMIRLTGIIYGELNANLAVYEFFKNKVNDKVYKNITYNTINSMNKLIFNFGFDKVFDQESLIFGCSKDPDYPDILFIKEEDKND